MKNVLRTYDELRSLPTFEDRLEYLKLDGHIGKETFGYDRYINQRFYTSPEWKRARQEVIIRDMGYDLGIESIDHVIVGTIIVHHMNPITVDDIRFGNPSILDPNFLISVSHDTHNLITYKGTMQKVPCFIERTPFDTCPWRR